MISDAGTSEGGNATFELVLRTSAELFAEKGFHGASMRQLAERGGTAPSGFYYYFRSKYAVLLAIIEAAMRILEDDAAAVPTDLPAAERLAALLESHIAMQLREPTLARVCKREFGELKKDDLDRLEARVENYSHLFHSAIEAGIEDGSFAAGIEVRVAAESMLVMAEGVLNWWEPEGRRTADETGQLIAQYALNVIRLPTSV